MSTLTEIPTLRVRAMATAIETLEEALAEAKAHELLWCIVIGEFDTGLMRRWSGNVSVSHVIGAIEVTKHAMLQAYEEQEQPST